MTIRELRSGDSQDQAMTREQYWQIRDSDPRPWPEPVNLLLQAIADAPDEAWRERAGCHPDNRDRPLDQWTAIWFPELGGTYTEARKICDACPVKTECRADGHDELFGMWGGDDTETRIRVRSGGLPPMTRHGYPFGAQAHRRRGEPACQECMDAQRRYETAYRARRKAKRDAA